MSQDAGVCSVSDKSHVISRWSRADTSDDPRLDVSRLSQMFLQILYQTVTHPVWPTRKLHPKVLGGFGKPADVISPTGESREYPAARQPFRLDGKDLDGKDSDRRG